MAIHIHIYGGSGLFPRSRTCIVGEEHIGREALKRIRQRMEDSRRSRQITDRGGIDCTMRPSDVIR